MTRIALTTVVVAMVGLSACADEGAGSGPPTTGPAITTPDVGAAPTSAGRTEPTEPAPTPTGPAPETTETAPEPTEPRFDFSKASAIVEEFVADRSLDGAGLAIVHRDHGLVHHEHWGEFGPDRVSLVASSSKMIVAGVLMRLQDDGLLDVDRPIAEIVGWGEGNPDVTPAQLVSNSSGLIGLLPSIGYGPYLCQFLPTGTLQECAAQIFTTESDDGDVIPPDTQFRYGGAQWQVAGAVAEVVSGRSWEDLVDEIYVEPCGLESLGFNNHFGQLDTAGFSYPGGFDSDPSRLLDTANPNIEAGAYITSGDYAELLLVHLRGGRCGDTQVLSEASIDRMHADRIGEVYDGSAGGGIGYGMGWWIDRASGRRSDGGAYGSVPWLDLEDGYGVYLVIEADSGTGNELAGRLYDPIDAAITGS